MRSTRRRKRRRLRRHLHRRRLRIDPRRTALLGVVAAIFAIAALFDRRGGAADAEELVTHVVERSWDPVDLIVAAGRTRRIVVLGDVHPSAETKLLAARAVEALARGPGLDAIALEVGAELQPYINAYLGSNPENASPLFAQPRTLGHQWGTVNAYLEIYRTVWRLNQELEPARRIRIIAADLSDWPPSRRLAPPQTAALYARRDAHMAETLEREVLGGHPGARVLVFMGGYHALKAGGAELNYGGGEPLALTWLASRLDQRYPGQVFSILVETAPRPGNYSLSTTQITSRAYDVFRRGLPGRGTFAIPVDRRFDFMRRPIREPRAPGIEISIQPRDYRFGEMVDGYIFLGTPRGIEFRR